MVMRTRLNIKFIRTLPVFLTCALDGDECSVSRLGHFNPGRTGFDSSLSWYQSLFGRKSNFLESAGELNCFSSFVQTRLRFPGSLLNVELEQNQAYALVS